MTRASRRLYACGFSPIARRQEFVMPPGLLKIIILAAIGFFIGAAIISHYNG
ncbi:hypothetical protein V3H18_14840 [Methylocystis sp. 9N]|uniref:Uncharacterized protein n=1 Tax=Methylocystis borbori TaxID=3118750 RepID=A0ABU7XKZ3_9HYPH